MVLASREHQVLVATNHEHEGGLFALHELFNEDLVAARTEDPLLEHLAEGGLGLGGIPSDDHALTGSEARGLEHYGESASTDMGECGRDRGEGGGGGGRDAVPDEEVLGEGLTGLEAGASEAGPVGEDAGILEDIDDAVGEWHLRADEDEVSGGLLGQGEHLGGFGNVASQALGLESHAAVARRDLDPGDSRGTETGLQQRVFAAARAEDKDVDPAVGHEARDAPAGAKGKRR
jgi:hypothetical protein